MNEEKKRKLLERAKKNFKEVEDYERTSRELMKSDLDAFYGDIWDAVAPGWRERLERYDRPVLQTGLLNPLIRRITNDILSMEPEIKAFARNTPDKKKAEYRQGLIRHIMYNSDAQEAISLAVKNASICGRGHFRIITDYVDHETANQSIMFEPIKNPLNVYMSTRRKGNDYSDCEYAFIVDRMAKEDFKEEYPDADPANWENMDVNQWYGSDDLMIAEYFEFEYKNRTLLFYEDGSKIYLDEVEKDKREEAKLLAEQSRDVRYKKLMWYKLTGNDVLDWKEIPGDKIPIGTVISDEGEDSDGNMIISGLVRHAKSSAWLYDLNSSLEAELLHQNTITPFIADPESIKGFEKIYAEAHIVPRGYLPAKTIVKEGVLVPRPERVAPVTMPQGIYAAKQANKDDMYSSSGVSEERMGYESNAQSGRAVLARSQESKMTNSNITRSVNKALTYAGRIINKWLPIYYDTKRIIQILDIENKPTTVEINTQGENNEMIDLGDAYDDIVVTMGAGYITSRMEAMENMMKFLQVNPAMAPIISDLIAENSDWPSSQKIAERIRTTMDTELLEAGGGADKMAIQLKQAVMQLQQSQQMIEQLQMALEQVTQKADDNAVKIELQEMKGQQELILQQLQIQADLQKELITANRQERTQNDDREDDRE